MRKVRTRMAAEDIALTIMMIVVVVASGVMIWKDYATKVIKDVKTIEWLESSSPTRCEDVKEEFSRIVEEDKGEKPTKVAFIVAGGNYQTCTYKVRVYYKLSDGQWYTFKMSWIDSRISPELDQRLSEIYRTCS